MKDVRQILGQDYLTLVVATNGEWIFQAPDKTLDLVGSRMCRVIMTVTHLANNAALHLQTSATFEGPWTSTITASSVGVSVIEMEFDADARYPLERYVRWAATGASANWELCFSIEVIVE